jgi:hypothetical protein
VFRAGRNFGLGGAMHQVAQVGAMVGGQFSGCTAMVDGTANLL